MTATASAIGKGFTFKRGDAASPEAFTTVVEIKKIGKFGEKRQSVEATTLDSNYEDFVAGMLAGGKISLEGNALPDASTQGLTSGMAALVRSGAKTNFKITSNTALGAKTWFFTALVEEWSIGDVAVKEVVPVMFSLQVVEGSAWASNASSPFGYA